MQRAANGNGNRTAKQPCKAHGWAWETAGAAAVLVLSC